MSFDCVALRPPAFECWKEVLLPHVQQGGLQRRSPGGGVGQEVADGDGAVSDVEDPGVEPQLVEDWRRDEADLRVLAEQGQVVPVAQAAGVAGAVLQTLL